MEVPTNLSPIQHNAVLKQIANTLDESIYVTDNKVTFAAEGALKNIFTLEKPAQERTVGGYFSSWTNRYYGSETELVKAQNDVKALIEDHKNIYRNGFPKLLLLTDEAIRYSYENQKEINKIIATARRVFRDADQVPAPVENPLVANYGKDIRGELDFIRKEWNVQLANVEKTLKEGTIPSDYRYGIRLITLIRLTEKLYEAGDTTARASLETDNIFNQILRMSTYLRRAENAKAAKEAVAQEEKSILNINI